MNSRTSIALIALSLIAGGAGAQSTQAVEWKVSEGGNGHWYQLVVVGPIDWLEAKTAASQLGGHLVTITSQTEQAQVWSVVQSVPGRGESPTRHWGPWIGGFQNRSSPSYSEPSGGWEWVNGEPWDYAFWAIGDRCWETNEAEDYLIIAGAGNSIWNDQPLNGCDNDPVISFVVEWEADCNGDGIVDYGQIQSGQLDDDNSDGIPDTCQYTVTGVIPVSGASSGGTAITVKGSNFPENPTVLVGGSPATNVIRVSATRLTAVTPAGLPGMTSVTVGNWVQPNAFYYRPECGSDLDQDGEVTAADIAIVLLDFGPCYSNAANTQPEDSTPFLLK